MADTVTVTKIVGQQAENIRELLRCVRCELRQYQADLCRRCRKPLPKTVVREVIKEIPVSVEVDVKLFGRGAPIVSLVDLERMAIAHALAETESAIEAAKCLGMGKTTLYRKVAEIFGKQASALRREIKARAKCGYFI